MDARIDPFFHAVSAEHEHRRDTARRARLARHLRRGRRPVRAGAAT